jgi:DNA-binding NarL/FixJ family response regulator
VIRVVIVEDNDAFREALEVIFGLSADLEVVAAAADARSAVALCVEHRPDVIVLDYRLPDVDGVEAATRLRAACPDAAILALTAAADGPQLDALLDAGAVACLTKDRELDEIVAAVRKAQRGHAEPR